ncbi:putative secreted protein (Por secretion system target) [Dyadobacter jejuensis]|uniref:Putative secreted protein (Por secretion system target) n=1 Tax=Dyadobacter jejuensis TaxID=1082580 RepID=A0A316AUF2_9BACT|nr:C25 family cysteine peptidase [Dyadobacter jejuensis]PWJ60320.1 putative secreted protein (Por secretion system target) [Dyadobacter jejuensis]
MKIRMFTRKLWLFAIILGSVAVNSQAQWSGAYGNEWLENKYSQEWVKIEVSEKGVQKVTLTGNFLNKANQLHLYHRGEEVALISASESEIEFYGVPNDGESDALLYRPYTGVRANPYYSWFSDKSAYFLTYSSTSPTKLAVNQAIIAPTGTPEPYHIAEELIVYSNSDNYDGTQNFVYHSLDQSYFVEGKGRSSKAYLKKDNGNGTFFGNPVFGYNFQLKNLVVTPTKQPEIEILLNGRTFSSNSIQASVGKSASSLTDYPGLIQFSDFIPYKANYTIPVSTDLASSSVDINGNGYFQVESKKVTTSDYSTGIYSVSYTLLTYPQAFDMNASEEKVFKLIPAAGTETTINISNVPTGVRVMNITDLNNVSLINGVQNGNDLQVVVKREVGQELILLVSKRTINGVGSNVVFNNHIPSDKDYLIITNENLYSEALNYASYRSTLGGGYRTLVVKIEDIYNQYNYGEPSPVAIRRFVDFMLKDGVRDKHNLLLIGPSTTAWNKMPRELAGDVPTIGFPGSDVLLIEGLAGKASEVGAIPMGRIPATEPTQVSNYLNKVKSYEGSQADLTWRKNVLHISGGLRYNENVKFGNYLANEVAKVTSFPFEGSVKAFIKADGDYGYPNTTLNIASDINNGTGFTAYFGHGSSHYTDNNLGYATDPARGYSNSGKYPVMYFNGCGVGNIFNGAFGAYPTSPVSNQIPLSSDWLLAENKGSIAFIGNSYYAFETSSYDFIEALYDQLFKADGSRATLGSLHRAAGLTIMTGSSTGRIAASSYDMANTHQTLLLGDPALQVLNVTDPLPVELMSFKGKMMEDNSIELNWRTAWEKGNSHFEVQRSGDSKSFKSIGVVDGKGDTSSESFYVFNDLNPIDGKNYYRLVQHDLGTDLSSGVMSRIIYVDGFTSKNIIVKPNPTYDKAQLVLPNDIQIESLELTNANGQLYPVLFSGLEIDLSQVPKGLYLLQIKTVNGEVLTRKILKN